MLSCNTEESFGGRCFAVKIGVSGEVFIRRTSIAAVRDLPSGYLVCCLAMGGALEAYMSDHSGLLSLSAWLTLHSSLIWSLHTSLMHLWQTP